MKKWHSEEKNGYTLIVNEGGKHLGYAPESGVTILEVDGYAFKDMNQNGVLDPYEDWRLPVEERVKDLVSKMDLDSKLGLSLHDGMFMILRLTQETLDKTPSLKARVSLMGKSVEELAALDPTEPTEYNRELITHDQMRSWLIGAIDGPGAVAAFNNNIQRLAEGYKYGIPVFFSTNPRASKDTHSDTTENDVSRWPSNLGLGATFQPEIAQRMAEIVSREYRAMGITMELGPQIDLASDPRWNRMSATFGSDEKLCADMARAVCDGLQTTRGAENGWGEDSVLAMCKHWPGSTGEGGRESHKESGKYTVYPGNHLDKHTYAWTEGAFRLNGPTGQCGAVMSCYDDIWEVGGDEAEIAGASFNKYVVETLLRKEHGFQGFVCTDFWITGNLKKERTSRPQVNAWGYTNATPPERALKEWESGVDQCGGTNEIEILQQAYNLALQKHGRKWADEKVNRIASRFLTYGFRVGGFDNPYVDPDFAEAFVGCRDFQEAGMEAFRKSLVLLKNNGVLPLNSQKKVWTADKIVGGIPDRAGNVDSITRTRPFTDELLGEFFTPVSDAEDAQAAIVLMDSPRCMDGYDQQTKEYVPISLQYRPYTAVDAREESIAGDYIDGVKENRSYRNKSVITYNAYDLDNLLEVRKAMGEKPVILILNCTNPVVPCEFEPLADAVLVCFAGTPKRVLLEAICGMFEPSGMLPFQMPEDMRTVERHWEDTPRDMKPYRDAMGNVWDFGFGMDWSGVIRNERSDKYR